MSYKFEVIRDETQEIKRTSDTECATNNERISRDTHSWHSIQLKTCELLWNAKRQWTASKRDVTVQTSCIFTHLLQNNFTLDDDNDGDNLCRYL